MPGTLIRKITLIVLAYLVALIGIFVADALAIRKVRDAGEHLSSHTIRRINLIHSLHADLYHAISEASFYASTRDVEDANEVRQALAAARSTLAALARADAEAFKAQPSEELVRSQRRKVVLFTTVRRNASELLGAVEINDRAATERALHELEQVEDAFEALDRETEGLLQKGTAQAAERIDEQIQSMLYRSAGGLSLSVLLLILGLLWIRQSVVLPVGALAAAADGVATGELDHAVAVTSSDEIGSLQRSFNVMVARLKQQTQSLMREQTALRAEIAERKRVEQHSTAFAALGQQLSTVTNSEAAAQSIAAVADDLIGWDAYSLTLYNAADDTLHGLLNIDLIDGQRTIMPKDDSGHTPGLIARQTLSEGSQLLLRDEPRLTAEELTAFGDTGRPSASLMFTPVRSRAGIVGILSVQSYTPQTYTAEDLRTLQGLADHCSGALVRLRAEEALRASEVELRAVFAAMSDVVMVLDAEGRYRKVAPTNPTLLYKPPAELIGRTLHEVFPAAQADEFLHAIRSTLQTKQWIRLEYSLHIEGRETYFAASISPMQEDYVVWVARDITKRRRMEEEQVHLASIVASSHDAIVSITLDGIIQSWNAAAERIYGYCADEVLGRSFTMLIPSERPDELAYLLDRVRRGEPVEQYETVRVRKDGRPIEVAVTQSPMRDAAGKLIGTSAIARDITERNAIDRMKSEFVSVVSHELRTPLTAIHGSLGLIAGGVTGELPPRTKMLIDIACKNSERLIRLINDILDIEKIESGKRVFNFAPIALLPIVEQALEVNRSYGEQFGVRFQLAEPVCGITVNADSDRLTQVLTNLLSNAAKFSPSHGTVVVSVQRLGASVRVAVADQGPGIPNVFRSRIFQKFAQADSSDTRQKGGTGLGLSISKAIVERHGGTINFEAAPGGGTIFFFELPLHEHVEDSLSFTEACVTGGAG